jgi:Mg2+ and Co2+ transporter CorA
VRDQLEEIASDVDSLAQRVGDLMYDALRSEIRGGDDAEGAKELERQLGKVRRSLAKAEQILRELARA